MTPYDFIRLAKPGSNAILISYGGENPDILSAFQRAVDLRVGKVHVVTGDETSRLAQMARQDGHIVHTLPHFGRDSGFVSTTGLLMTVSAMLAQFRSKALTQDEIDQLSTEPKLTERFRQAKSDSYHSFSVVREQFSRMDRLHIVALGSHWTSPALIDLDSKLTEGAVCTVEVCESKNYTHGRYLNAYRNKSSRLFLLFSSPDDSDLMQFLEGKFKRDFPVVVIGTQYSTALASVDLLVRELYFTLALSQALSLDIARPIRFPQEARGLYSWGPIYSPQH
jgi:fructoselysine-6-P-deglycase FrlB-like protein